MAHSPDEPQVLARDLLEALHGARPRAELVVRVVLGHHGRRRSAQPAQLHLRAGHRLPAQRRQLLALVARVWSHTERSVIEHVDEPTSPAADLHVQKQTTHDSTSTITTAVMTPTR